MAWSLLPTDYTDATWSGLKKYVQIDNPDDTVSFQDVTQYSNKEKSFFGAIDANRMNEAINVIMSMLEQGTDLYTAFQIYFAEQKQLFETNGEATMSALDAFYREHINDFEASQTTAFETWFNAIKGQLSTDAAGHLQLQIDDINAELPLAGGSKININFTYEDVDDVQYLNEHYTLTVGDEVREKDFSPTAKSFDEYGILNIGTATLKVEFDYRIISTGEINHTEDTLSVNIPYFGRYAFDYTITASIGGAYKDWLNSISEPDVYGSLEAVLENEILVRKLMTLHASSDYLVAKWNDFKDTILTNRNAMKWIGLRDYICDKLMAIAESELLNGEYWEFILKDKVPVMTSNTEPSGEAIGYGNRDSSQYDYWKVFDRTKADIYDGWIGNEFSKGNYVGYHFINPTCVYAVYTENRDLPNDNNGRDRTYKIEASNDGINWVDISGIIDRGEKSKESGYGHLSKINNNNYYLYYRYVGLSSDVGILTGVAILQFYGRSLKDLVPKMTSNTEPSGEAFVKNNISGYEAYKAFDGDNQSIAISSSPNTTSGGFIGYRFDRNVVIKQTIVLCANSATNNAVLQSSNDGVNYTNISETKATDENLGKVRIISNSEETLKYCRVLQVSASSANNFGFRVIQFYGLDYSEDLDITLYSAANDTVSLNDTVLCTTDTEAKAKCSITPSMWGMTLKSSVALDLDEPDNNNKRYTRVFNYVDDNMLFMPEGAVYWYGNQCIDKTGGWTYEYNTNYGTIPLETNRMYVKAGTGWHGRSNETAINKKLYSSLKCIFSNPNGFVQTTIKPSKQWASVTGETYFKAPYIKKLADDKYVFTTAEAISELSFDNFYINITESAPVTPTYTGYLYAIWLE